MPHNREKTHCPQGHRYSQANTAVYTRVDKYGHTSQFRVCKTCNRRQRQQRYGTIRHAEG